MSSTFPASLGTGVLAIIAAIMAGHPSSVHSVPLRDEPRSTVSVLVDLSQSWHNDVSSKENQTVLETVFEAVIELGKLYRPPTQVWVLPIGAASLMRPPLCNAIFDPKLIGPAKTGNVFTREASFRKYLVGDCARFVLSRPEEEFTDISGAIDTAARLAAAQPDDERALIVLSDMEEDLPAGQTPPELALPGFRVLIVYRVLVEDRRRPQRLDGRLEDWKNRLIAAGAHVEVVPDQGITPGQIGRLLLR